MNNLLIKEPPLQVLPSLAKLIGLNEAIALQQLHYWIENKNTKGEIDPAGNKWIFNTYDEWKEDNFPFWSVSTIRRIFQNLESKKLIVSIQLKAKQHDMTNYYRIDYEQLELLNLNTSKSPKRADVKRNTETTSKTTTDKKIAATPKANTYPALVIFRSVTKRYPHEANWQQVIDAVLKINLRLGRDVTKEDLLPFFTFWTGKGYNPYGLGWLDWAVAGKTPENGKVAQNFINKAAKFIDPVTKFLQAHEQETVNG